MPLPIDFPDHASIKDITQRFGLSRATLYRLIGRGEIEAIKVGSATRLVTRSVERYFEGLPRLRCLAESDPG